jgi:prepilin-type N-terminal cleavage/methylation domain-containing protein
VKSERGVSVLELIIALAIGGVLTLMALPYLQRYMALRDMRQTARLLGADLRLTQQYAVTQNQTFRLQYTAASAQYTLLRTSDGTVVKVVAVPSSVAITTTFSSNLTDFASTGAPVQSGMFCVTEGTSNMKVDVQPATGRVQIAEVATCP